MNSESWQQHGDHARKAARSNLDATKKQRNSALSTIAAEILDAESKILEANEKDLAIAKQNSIPSAFMDRLNLNRERIAAMSTGIQAIASLPDPVGKILSTIKRPNGLIIEKTSTPIGVIGVIYESRPNVTADAAALCLKAGNSVILRGGSAAIHSNTAIYGAIARGLGKSEMDQKTVQLIASTERDAVGQLLKGLNGCIDVIVPRGGKSLVGRVQAEARIPVFAHLEGNCHTYVHQSANPDMAREIVLNAKLRRTGICGATETLLLDKNFSLENSKRILESLHQAGCEIFGDQEILSRVSFAKLAQESDWSTEYLDAKISVRVVDGIADAITHIGTYGSDHTECIVTEDDEAAERFFKQVDSAIVMHNASTQFADGGEFGMGAEIGIATGRMHARGPVGVEQLTTFKYVVRGSGQVRK